MSFGPFDRTFEIDPGCNSAVEGGCGAQRCDFNPPPLGPGGPDWCVVVAAAAHMVRGTTTPGCGGNNPHGVIIHDPVTNEPVFGSRCLEDFCDGMGRCLRNQPNDAYCDEDQLDCTVDVCRSFGGDLAQCESSIHPLRCFIGGVCYDPEDERPDDPRTPACGTCQPMDSRSE